MTCWGTRPPGAARERTYLLEDCTSAVVVPGVVDYTDEADAAFERFAAAGMHVVRSTDPIAEWPGIGPRVAALTTWSQTVTKFRIRYAVPACLRGSVTSVSSPR